MVATGSRGDVEPYLALGRALVAAGHRVSFVTTSDFVNLVARCGLGVVEIPISVRDRLADPDVRRDLQQRGPIVAFRTLATLARDSAQLAAEVAKEAAAGSDVVVAGLGGHQPALAAARALGLPLVRAFNVPLTPTAAYPGALFPNWPAGPGGLLNRVSQVLSRRVVWTANRQSLRGWTDPFELSRYPGLLLYGISPSLLPQPADWPAGIVQTGFWFNPPPEGWRPPEKLLAFFDEGPAPVYIGFGSMTDEAPEQTIGLVLDAVDMSGVRAVVSSGWAGLGATDLPDTVQLVGDVPHEWLFARTSTVVHHGGAGTTAAGLRAGVPSIIVPFHGDQPFWGRVIHERGLGPRPLPRPRLTAVALAEALRNARNLGCVRPQPESVRGSDPRTVSAKQCTPSSARFHTATDRCGRGRHGWDDAGHTLDQR